MKPVTLLLACLTLIATSLRLTPSASAAESPRLTASLLGEAELVLQWPVESTPHRLEYSVHIGTEPTWQTLDVVPRQVGGSWEVRLPTATPARFFRLRETDNRPTAFFLPDSAPTRNLEVEYDGQGNLHFAYVRHSNQPEVQEVVYGTCPAGRDCDRPENWNTVVVHSGAIGTLQLEVTADGRPRLALQDQYTVAGSRLAYLACEGNCLQSTAWRGLALGENLPVGEVFARHTDQRWFAIDAAGRPRLLVSNPDGAFFLACDQGCTEPSGDWSNTPLDTTGNPFLSSQLFTPVLQLGPDGQPHILGQNSRELVYLTARGDFRQADNWRRLVLSDPMIQGVRDEPPVALQFATDLDLELDRQGGLVAAFGGLVPGIIEPRTYLFRCPNGCDELSNWGGRPFPGTVSGGLDLALDSSDRPYFVLAGQMPSGERRVQVATCDGGDCYDFNANWRATTVGTSTQLEIERPVKRQPETPALCSIPTTSWEFAASRLIFRPDGTPRLVSNAVATSICQPGMDEWVDRWGVTRRGRTIDVWVIEARARWSALP